MSSDWIKMRVDLYRDPKVCVIADELLDPDGDLASYVDQNCQSQMTVTRNVTRNVTVGALVTVWGVMRHRGKRENDDLVCRGVNLKVIDDICDLPGFGHAMQTVGWVVTTDKGIVFPSFFDEYNVDPNDKKSASSSERQRRYRENMKSKSDVTRDVTRDVTVTHREEKRREENKEHKKPISDHVFFEGVDSKVVADFKVLRKTKKAPVTQTAVDGIKREAEKAGMTLGQALVMCCERGWGGFKADWVTGNQSKPGAPTPPRRKQLGEGSSTNYGNTP